MSDQLIFRDVWQKNDAKAERDAIAAWHAADDRLGNLTTDARAKALCVVGYDNGRICAISTCQILYMPIVRENMAFIQVFVPPEDRQKGLVVPLTLASHVAMSRFALEHPALEIGGTAGRVAVRGTMDKPVTNALMVLIGYSIKNEPLVVRWFDHFKLDEEAARARDPRQS
jgi:hypothetical protein